MTYSSASSTTAGESGAGSRTVVCTVVSANYLARARVLMDSVARQHPEWDRHVLLVDEVRGRFATDAESFAVTEVAALAIPKARQVFFRYSILELNTAVKPPFLRWLVDTGGYDRVIYLDPDIELFTPMTEVERRLSDGALMCLTPHLLGRNGDERKPTELEVLRAGSFNLGFLAVARHPELHDFLDWWWEKLETQCVVDFETGLFVDQKWMDLAPGLFSDVEVIRDPGYNVAYWNLGHRRVREGDEGWEVLGRPLVFFHFSGLDIADPEPFSKHQDRFTLSTLGAEAELVRNYCAAVTASGEAECLGHAYAFGRLADGSPVFDGMRALYRTSPEVQEAGGDDPFQLDADYWNASVDGRDDAFVVSRLAHQLWRERPDLQANFPDPLGTDRARYVPWFADCGIDAGLPETYVLGARRTLAAGPARAGRRARLTALLRRAILAAKPIVAPYLPRSVKSALKRRVLGLDPPVLRSQPGLPEDRGRLRALSGFHSQDEHDFVTGEAWMSDLGEVLLPEGLEGRRLVIEGTHRAPFHVGDTSREQLRIDVELDGEVVGNFRVDREGPFRISCDLAPPESPPRLMGLRADSTIVPIEYGVGQDSRTLSIRVARVELDARPLVEFGTRSTGTDRPVRGHAARSVGEAAATGVNLVGYFRQDLGIGESVRLGTLAADAAGIDARLVDFSEGCTSRSGNTRFATRLGATNPFLTNLVHVNADQLPLAYHTLGADFFDGRHTVGIWHWELPEFPEEWVGSFELVDELWAPSRFVQAALSEKSPVPVVHMPHAIEPRRPAAVDRREFDLPDDRFLFLTMYDMHSFQARKNPEAVIEAFVEAFPDAERAGVGLVVKVMNAESTPADAARLRTRAAALPGIRLVEGTFDRDAVDRLESACDAFVSLHRSEGFGLGLAESMALGKPVIATGWSGNLDFMDESNSALVDYRLVEIDRDHGPYRKGQIWAEPDVEDAARWMRRFVDEREATARRAAAGRGTILERFAPEAIGRRQLRRLRRIAAGAGFLDAR